MLHKPTLHLPSSVTVADVADAARLALTQFLAMEPDKRALSDWLVGFYGRATAFAPRRPHSIRPSSPPSARAPGSAPPPPSVPPPTEHIGELVTTVQREAFATIHAAVEGGPEALVQRMPSMVQVVRVEDALGAHGFAPIDAPRLKLNDRVLSLIVADFLTRPDDFARSMAEHARPRPRITRSGIAVRAAAPADERDKGTG